MRILLTANASYVPPRGGATRSNLIWLDQMARAGHECRIVCGASGEGAPLGYHGSIAVVAVEDPARRLETLRQQIREFRPDWVLVSSEDLGHRLLREAQHEAPGRVVYLAHTPQFFPFGPASWNPDRQGAEVVAQAAAIVAIGHHMAEYIEGALGRPAVVIHPPIYGAGPYPNYSNFDRGFVTMINPCAVKGISIFLEIARRLPEYEFAAIPGWGTTSEDRRALGRVPNIRLLPNPKDIDQLLAQTRVLVNPALWYEGFGLIVMESMLRGIPVVASDSGGLKEAKRGTGYVIPVRTIERFEPVFDEHSMPRPVLPENDAAPWVAAVRELLTGRAAYERESSASREAAARFVSGLDAGDLERLLQRLEAPRGRAAGERAMRVMLAQNSQYYPAHGGGDKSNRLLMEALAARGHQCRVVARISVFGEPAHRQYLDDLAARGVTPLSAANGVVTFERAGVEVRVVTNASLRAYFAEQVEAWRPDVILTSTDDPAQLLLEVALRAGSARVVYLARATLALPFGPDCAFPSPVRTERIRAASAVVGVSQYVADYIRKHAGVPAVHVPISLMEGSGWPALGRFDNEFVTFVNPCAVKGIAIFLALADAFPDTIFAAVPTWGTTLEDRAALERRGNVRVLDPVDDIDLLLKRTRVLLVPSLWAEARSRIVLEAMLRGVPVMAGNVGGIPEAKMGVPYLLPVNPIATYEARVDEQMVPVAEVPLQDLGPWHDALARLLGDRAHYEEIAAASRAAAQAYAATLNAGPLERILQEVPVARVSDLRAQPKALDSLSPEKRRLLALRLRQRAPASSWFPGAEECEGLRLFWFPHAGGGAAQVPGLRHCCPVRLPGRESRLAEAPFERMGPLVEALANAMEPYLARPFAFFGHSMGAAVAFELARLLRRRHQKLPKLLIASGARAPQYRRDHVPPAGPGDEQFLAELRRLEGIPHEVLDDPALMRAVLPALRADTALYRNYVYAEDEPLACPIRAYGGVDDPNVLREHLEAWALQTSASFGLRLFPGGHFYLNAGRAALEQALAEELEGLV